jgi:hypothetical protein
VRLEVRAIELDIILREDTADQPCDIDERLFRRETGPTHSRSSRDWK